MPRGSPYCPRNTQGREEAARCVYCGLLRSAVEFIEGDTKVHDFPVECYNSAAQLIAKQEAGGSAVFSLIPWCAESLSQDAIRELSRK